MDFVLYSVDQLVDSSYVNYAQNYWAQIFYFF